MSVRSLHADFEAFFRTALNGRAQTRTPEIPVALCWSIAELGQALEYLAQKSALPTIPNKIGPGNAGIARSDSAPAKLDPMPGNGLDGKALDEAALDRWIGILAGRLGLETEPLQSTYAEVDQYLSGAGPALIKLAHDAEGNDLRFVALLRGGQRWLHLIAQDGSVQPIRHAVLRDVLWADATRTHTQSIEQMLGKAGVGAARHPRVQQAILKEVLGSTVRQDGWLLRLPPSAHLWHQARQAGLTRTAGALISGYFAQLLLTIAAWWMIGLGALAGHFDWGWLLGWALLLLTTVPFQAWVTLTQSQLAIGISAIFKQRLLFGVLQLDPEEVRHQGAGQFLGRVLASDTVEQLGLASGFVAILALFQLAAAVAILAAGVGGWLHAWLLVLWVGVTIGLSYFYLRRSRAWVETYREMTNDLVERMVGHRTRLAQEDRQQWHAAEDQLLGHYLHLQRKLDQIEGQLKAVVPRGWMVIGVGGLVYTLLFVQPTPAQIAISLGGILFAYQALTTVVLGLKSVVGAHLAWQEVRTLFHAAARGHGVHNQSNFLPTRARNSAGDSTARKAPLLTARDVDFRYQVQGRPVLQGCDLQLYHGDRVLLEGPSGGGKSTLTSILAGLRAPQSGLLLLHDVDQQTMGVAAWREQVVAVPQFHENYILTGTLAFNLLMGRRWPPQPADLAAAETLCHELGLGDLINRMPAGLQQMVGESGWQLSHGERSRVYIARALLQGADLMILDESFAALDPENLERALHCVLERAPTLLVIAHP